MYIDRYIDIYRRPIPCGGHEPFPGPRALKPSLNVFLCCHSATPENASGSVCCSPVRGLVSRLPQSKVFKPQRVHLKPEVITVSAARVPSGWSPSENSICRVATPTNLWPESGRRAGQALLPERHRLQDRRWLPERHHELLPVHPISPIHFRHLSYVA